MELHMSKNIKKALVCGASLMMLASAGAGFSNLAQNNVSAHASVTRTGYGQYRHIVNYLHWVQRYNHTHEHNWHTYYLTHLYKYTKGLNRSELNEVSTLFNRYHTWYYANDSSMDKAEKFFTTPQTAKVVPKKHHVRASKYTKRAHKYSYAKRAKKRAMNYSNATKYLNWVQWHDDHNAQPWSQAKVNKRLDSYMGYLTHYQKESLLSRDNDINIYAPRYYRTHFAKRSASKVHHHRSRKAMIKPRYKRTTKRNRKRSHKAKKSESYADEIKRLETPKNKKAKVTKKAKPNKPAKPTLKPQNQNGSTPLVGWWS